MFDEIRLRSADPAGSAAFLRHLGFAGEDALRVGGQGPCVRLEPGSGRPPADGVFWKLGLTVPALEPRVAALRAAGVEVGSPGQLEGVGYLCHARGPGGLTVELLQQTFRGRPARPGAEAVLAHITLRVADLAASLAFYTGLGLHELARVAVPARDLLLVFLAFRAEQLPPGTVRAQREWLWQRPYPCLELVHRPGLRPAGLLDGEAGLAGLCVTDAGAPGRRVDPDGVPVLVG